MYADISIIAKQLQKPNALICFKGREMSYDDTKAQNKCVLILHAVSYKLPCFTFISDAASPLLMVLLLYYRESMHFLFYFLPVLVSIQLFSSMPPIRMHGYKKRCLWLVMQSQ